MKWYIDRIFKYDVMQTYFIYVLWVLGLEDLVESLTYRTHEVSPIQDKLVQTIHKLAYPTSTVWHKSSSTEIAVVTAQDSAAACFPDWPLASF